MRKILGIILSVIIGLMAYPIMIWVYNALTVSSGNIFFDARIINGFMGLIIAALFPVLYLAISIGICFLLKNIIKLNPLIIIIFVLIGIFGGTFYDVFVIKGQDLKNSLEEAGLTMIWPFIVCAVAASSSSSIDVTTTYYGAGMSRTRMGDTTIDSQDIGDNLTVHTVKDGKGNTKTYKHWKYKL